jgi:hypothetical protein
MNGKRLSIELFKTPHTVKDLHITPWLILHILTFSMPHKVMWKLASSSISIHLTWVERNPLSIDARCEVQATDMTWRPKYEPSGASEIPLKNMEIKRTAEKKRNKTFWRMVYQFYRFFYKNWETVTSFGVDKLHFVHRWRTFCFCPVLNGHLASEINHLISLFRDAVWTTQRSFDSYTVW